MAITAEQKKKVQDLISAKTAAGIPTQQAIKESFTEVAGEGSFEREVKEKQAVVAAKVAEAKKKKEVEEAVKVQADLQKAEADYIFTRARDLESSGLSPEIANQRARAEFQKSFGEPIAQGFGEYGERKLDYLVPDTALPDFLTKKESTGTDAGFDIFQALRPQRLIPGIPEIQALESQVISPSEGALQIAAGSIGMTIPWDKVKENLVGSGLSSDEADDEVSALKKTLEKRLTREIKKRPNLLSTDPKKDKDAYELLNKEWQATIDEISGIGKAKEAKALKEATSVIAEPTTLEVAAKALDPQKIAGAGVPDYTETQMDYMEAQRVRAKEKELKQRLESGEQVAVYKLKDGKEISVEDYEARMEKAQLGKRTDAGLVGAQKINRSKTKKELEKELEQKYKPQWFENQELKAEYLKNPEAFKEKYKQTGILEDATIYGGTKESTTGWLIRSALTVPNLFAGAVSKNIGLEETYDIPFIGEIGGTEEALNIERRRRRPELYKDSPVLYNVATNKGFLGEGQEVADILDLEGAERYAYLGGMFMADILDPSLDLAKAAGTGAKVGFQTNKALKTLGALGSTSAGARRLESLKAAGKAGYNDLIDENLFTAGVNRAAKVEQ